MNGYTRIPHALMRNGSLPPIAKVVWSLIAGMREDYKPTIATYCGMANCHPNTWRRVIKMLEGFGMITVTNYPNGVSYRAVLDPSNWSVDGNKNCDPINCDGNKFSNPKGNNDCMGEGNKNCDPIRITIEEHKNKKQKEYAHAQGFGEIWDEWFGEQANQTIESLCMHERVTINELKDAAELAIIDMTMNGDTSKLGKADKQKSLYGLMLFKLRKNNGQRTNQNGNGKANTVTGFKILNRS